MIMSYSEYLTKVEIKFQGKNSHQRLNYDKKCLKNTKVKLEMYLNLGLDILNSIRGLNLKGDGLPGQGLDEDLHATSESEDQVEGRLLLDVVIGQSAAILKLLSGKNQSLLVWWDPLLILKCNKTLRNVS